MRDKKPNLLASVLMVTFGIMFFFVGMVGVLLRQFRFESAAEGYKVITPHEHPAFFWACVLFNFSVSSHALSSAVTDLRCRRERRRHP